MPKNETEKQSSTVVGKISGLVGLYAIFVFLSGWTYLDYYYRTFGIYTRWLDISIPETLMKGFIILFEGGEWLWVIYVFILVVPVLFEVFPNFQSHKVAQLVTALIMLSCLPITYYISRAVGSQAARQNQGDASALPDLRMATKCGTYIGKLVFIKDGLFYVHDARLIDVSDKNLQCWKPSEVLATQHTTTIFRTEEVEALEISEYP
jgi:hypothetical protein